MLHLAVAPHEFSDFVALCEKLRQTRGKNAKVALIAEYLQKLDEHSLQAAVMFLAGEVFPKGSGITLNVGFGTIMRSLSEIARLQPQEVQEIYIKHGDMGALAEYAVAKKQQGPLLEHQLELPELQEQLRKIAGAAGAGAADAKRKILTGILINCSPLEAKYIVKIATGEMRIGAVEGLVELGVAKAFGSEPAQLRQALLLSSDITHVAILAKRGSLSSVIMKPLVPLSFMLADVMFSAEEIADYYAKPMICEFKYDGIRVQLHKFGEHVRMFSRRLEDVTGSFPEIEAASRKLGTDFILDGEVVAFRNSRPLHFQELQKRLRRKLVTEELIREVPVIFVPYDVLYIDHKPVTTSPLAERKHLLSQLPLKEPVLNLGYTMATSAQEIAAAFDKSRKIGHEGLVLKEPESQYHPGKRGRHWVKLKRELDTIDAVIVVAEYGHGKRAGTLSDYTFAVRDGAGGILRALGKAYSGLTDVEISKLTARLRSIAIKDDGYRLKVRPEIVLEVAFDSIQKSERHDSGFALRFPRIKRIRIDKTVNDIDSLDKVRALYEKQAHVKSR